MIRAFGYKIEKGRAIIEPQEAERLRQIYKAYLSGLSLVKAAKTAGLTMTHSSVKNLLQNPRYLGDDYYPQIVEKELFDAFEAERQRREQRRHCTLSTVKRKEMVAPIQFRMNPPIQEKNDPYEQAEYVFSLIEPFLQQNKTCVREGENSSGLKVESEV